VHLYSGSAGAQRVGAVTANEPPVLVSNHRPEVLRRIGENQTDGGQYAENTSTNINNNPASTIPF
jgi:hypothetical protein